MNCSLAAYLFRKKGSDVDDTLIASCLPERLHPVSMQFLEAWLNGEMSTAQFLRWFHMPNSDYLEVAQCILAAVTNGPPGLG